MAIFIFGIWACLFICYFCFGIWIYSYAQDVRPQPITVNGDVVEYSPDSKVVTATGNVEVSFKGTKLTCQKLSVNTETKEAQAEGNVRLDDAKGVLRGSKIIYNFNNKTGTIIEPEFRASPYFGKAEKLRRVSDAEFIALYGYATTCSFDKPHYHIRSKKIDVFPGDKIQIKDATFFTGRGIPLLHLPQYNHSLRDPLMHVQFMPGKSKDWGTYLLTAWRYNLTDNISGRLYLDYRTKLGIAEGFGTNYNAQQFGKGDFKYYYSYERPKEGKFQRYLVRWRHKWDIDEKTDLVSEFYKIVDSKRANLGTTYNILKDYFPREYEKDDKPLSYVLLHRSFNYSSIDFIIQKRVNRWYEQLEKLPQIKYSLPSLQLEGSPFYFENNTEAASFNYKYPVPLLSVNDTNVSRFDTSNRFSLPFNLAFVHLDPFVMNRETFYSSDIYGEGVSPRTVFYSGLDISTKFYRIFDVNSDFLGMDVNGLRHIITPTIGYAYNHEPSIPSSKLKQMDTIDSIGRSSAVTLELSNKLQTKRKGQTVDFADLRISTAYNFYQVDPLTNNKSKGSFADFLIDFKIVPYAWLRVDLDATYKPKEHYFSEVNYDINFDFGKERYIGLGQRYELKGGNEITANFTWRFNPKWKFSFYDRYNLGHDPNLPRGLREQEYTITRDLHCWEMDISYNIKKGEGNTFWLAFRLKAFPEMEFGFNQSYHKPQSGSQSNL